MSRYASVRIGPSFMRAILALLAVLALPHVGYAGGVAVVLDRQPADPEAGKAFTVGFLVRSAHEDRTPIEALEPTVRLTRLGGDEQVKTTATPEGAAGHYVASILLPTAGQWRWSIQPFGDATDEFRTMQPTLNVRAPGQAPAAVGLPSGPIQNAVATDRASMSVFEPRALTIAAGTTMRWRNSGKLLHTMTADDGSFASGAVEPGGTFEYTFVEPGSYAYYCEYHGGAGGQGQSGTIIVTAAQAAPRDPASSLSQISSQPAAEQAQQQLPAAGMTREIMGGLALTALCLVGLGLAIGRRRRRHS
jgi:plastocyanin